MANKSNWKGSEEKAALLFPGGRRRTRVGGGTYAEVADDVIWGPEYKQEETVVLKIPIMKKDPKTGKKKRTGEFRKVRIKQPRVTKICMQTDYSACAEAAHICAAPVYIEVKKRERISEAITMLRAAEAKYIKKGATGRVVLIQHPKSHPSQYVTVKDEFFRELIRAWCERRGLFEREMEEED